MSDYSFNLLYDSSTSYVWLDGLEDYVGPAALILLHAPGSSSLVKEPENDLMEYYCKWNQIRTAQTSRVAQVAVENFATAAAELTH